ncbi:MAG: helix-turn-helix domain-containing protein [Chloroflexi bacterium]|nr:MAG: helix-turn-helix domain-containing protein [Chloroflexota bacterium]
MPQSPYYTADEVAEILHTHVETVRKWCRSGKLEGARKFGKDWFIPRTTIDPQPPQQKPTMPQGEEQTT